MFVRRGEFGAEVADHPLGHHNAATRRGAQSLALVYGFGERMVDRSHTNGAHTAAGPAPPPDPAAGNEPDRLAILLADLSRLGRYARYYTELRLDSLKLSAREAMIAGVWGAMGAVVGVAALVTGVVMLLTGISRGVGLLAGNDWAGPLVTGLVVLAGATIAVAALGRQLRSSALARTQAKYETLRVSEPAPTSPTNGATHDRA
jgi:hypothetical protein